MTTDHSALTTDHRRPSTTSPTLAGRERSTAAVLSPNEPTNARLPVPAFSPATLQNIANVLAANLTAERQREREREEADDDD